MIPYETQTLFLQFPYREIVDGVLCAEGLSCHDVHILGEEHATPATLRHRLDKGVLYLREVSGGSDGLVIIDDPGATNHKERIVAGVQGGVRKKRPGVVRLLRSEEPGRLRQRPAVIVVGVIAILLQGSVIMLREAEGAVSLIGEGLGADEHPNAAHIHRGAERIQHRADDGIGEAVGLIPAIDAVNRPGHLIVHREDDTIIDKVSVGCIIHVDAIRIAVRHKHEGGNLNIVLRDPLLHKLRDKNHALHGRGVAKPDDRRASLADISFPQVGEKALPLPGAVTGRGKAIQLRIPEIGLMHLLMLILCCLAEHKARVGIVILDPLRQFLAVKFLVAGKVPIGEAEHLKRNLRPFAEPNQLRDLMETFIDDSTHRPGQVKHEHDAVILPVLLDDLGQEDIVVGAVLMQAVKVEHPRLLGALTANLVRCLAALKLRDQLTDERIGLLDILAVFVKVDRQLRILLVLLKQGIRSANLILHIGNRGERDGRVIVPITLLAIHARRKIGQVALPALSVVLVLLVGGLTFPRLVPVIGLLPLLLLLKEVLLLLLNGIVIIQFLRKSDDLRESFHAVHKIGNALLHARQIDADEARNPPLEVDIEAVDKPHRIEIHLGEAKGIAVNDFLITQEEVPARPRILVLHLLLNANILNHVRNAVKELAVVALLLRFVQQTLALLIGSPQRVADFMRHKHRLESIGDIPHGHDEMPMLDIKGCRFRCRVERES